MSVSFSGFCREMMDEILLNRAYPVESIELSLDFKLGCYRSISRK